MADYSQLAAAIAPDASTDAPQQENLLSLDTWKRKFGRLAEAFSDAPRLTPLDVPFSAYEGYQRLQNPDPNAQPLPDSNPMVTGAQVVNHMINPFAGEASPEVRAAMDAQLPLLGAIKAYHGSPHDFDAFDMSKIGTGEGAQAFGHGLYFAGNPGVAKSYQGRPEQRFKVQTTYKGEPYSDPLYFGTRDQAEEWSAQKRSEGFGADVQDNGRLYEVNLDVEPHDLLDYDKALKDQPEKIRKILEERFGLTNPDAQVGLTLMGGRPEERAHFSRRLAEAGIPGIRYLDQGSRAAGEGSHNYVMFSDEPVSILSKK